MKIFVENNGIISINEKKDYLSEGGEGKIFLNKNIIYKIYLDRQKVLNRKKFSELQSLSRKNIIKPDNMILNDRSEDIGFTMRFISDTDPICKFFSNSYQKDNQIDEKIILKLVESIQETIEFIHTKKCLVVDGNEFNYLVQKSNPSDVYFIDVDSYQTPNFPASAIMDSIKDPHTKGFNIGTDWYSFAIIACQLFVGIHPYRGTHPKYGKKDFIQRTIDNVSIFRKDVSIPSSARSFDLIPKEYKDWFVNVFEKGSRIAPPNSATAIGPIHTPKIIKTSENFDMKLIEDYKSDIIHAKRWNGKDVVRTQKSIWIDRAEYDRNNRKILFSKEGSVIWARIENGVLKLESKEDVAQVPISCNRISIIENRLIAFSEESFSIIEIDKLGKNLTPMIKNTFTYLKNSTQIFEGLLLSNVLGLPHLIIPYFDSDKVKCAIKEFKELKGYTVLSAKRDRNVVVIIARNKKSIDNEIFVLKFDDNFNSLNFTQNPTDADTANFTTTSSGIGLLIEEDGKLKMFRTRFDDMNFEESIDKNIETEMILCDIGRPAFFTGSKLYSISRRK